MQPRKAYPSSLDFLEPFVKAQIASSKRHLVHGFSPSHYLWLAQPCECSVTYPHLLLATPVTGAFYSVSRDFLHRGSCNSPKCWVISRLHGTYRRLVGLDLNCAAIPTQAAAVCCKEASAIADVASLTQWFQMRSLLIWSPRLGRIM